VPPGDFFFDRLFDNAKIEFFNPLLIPLSGASGGPVLTERSQLIGMTLAFGGNIVSRVEALPWDYIRRWMLVHGISKNELVLRNESRSAASLRRNNVEFSAAATTLLVPDFGWLNVAPAFRINTNLPAFPLIGVSFDFTSTQADRITVNKVQGQDLATVNRLTLTIPSISAELHAGNLWSPLRRKDLLGGLYVAGGVASVGLQQSVTGQSPRENNIRAWTGIFDAGWRYRFAGRSWGLTASYREGVLFGNAAQQLYPRFRSATAGLFVVFR
jgi:hypothetical protein